MKHAVYSTPSRSNSSRVLRDTWHRHLRRPYQLRPEFTSNTRQHLQAAYEERVASLPPLERLDHWWKAQGYKYFIWRFVDTTSLLVVVYVVQTHPLNRKDALNDLQIFASINIAIVLVGGLLKRLLGEVVSDAATDAQGGQLLQNTYQVPCSSCTVAMHALWADTTGWRSHVWQQLP